MSVEVTVDLEPEFEIPEYENFEVSVQPTDVSDEEIDKEINALRDQRASFDEVDREAKEGDYIKCSYEGKIDGNPVAEILPDFQMYG